MKFSNKTSSRRKNRKAHFTSSSSERRKLMTAPLSKELRQKYHVRNIPVRTEDEVRVLRGFRKGTTGKVLACYRKKWVIHVAGCTKQKANGGLVNVGLNASKVEIIKLKQDKDRKNILERRDKTREMEQGKGKHTQASIETQ